MSTSSQLCSLCQGISVRALCVSENDEGEETNPYGYQHQPCYNALVQSAKTCVLCLLILSELEKARESGLYFPTCDKDNADSMISLLSIKRCIEELDSPKGLTSIKIQWGKHALPLAQVSLVTHPSDPLAISGDIAGRVKTGGRNSESTFDRIKSWYRECSEGHLECRAPIDPIRVNRLPTRVIDVRLGHPLSQPCLVETKGQFGSYTALTYCWGKSQTLTTRPETYKQRLEGFHIDELSQTVRDAVIITRELGIPFLWVDAICIIQGDAVDWATESGEMAHVYGDATITISAAAAHDASMGCFREEWLPSQPLIPLRSKCSTSDHEGTMFVSTVCDNIVTAVEENILNTRGWALQERVLSPRIVHFAQDQMYWECRRHHKSEDGLVDQPSSLIKQRIIDPEFPFSESMLSWRHYVEEYSQRDLSHMSDKLPALSGLAYACNLSTRSSYIAGMWESDLPGALLWRRETLEPASPSRDWRAPSWSWASFDGPVSWDNLDISFINTCAAEKVTGYARMDSWNVELASSNVYGAINSGWLKLNACIKNAKTGIGEYQLPGRHDILDDYDRTVGFAEFDDNITTPPAKFDCILVGKPQYQRTLSILAVISTGEVGHFFRVGWGAITEDGWFDAVSPSEVTLH